MNYLNPTCQGIHLKLVNKFEQTKDNLEEMLSVWKGEKNDDEVEESTVETTKLSSTELLRKRMEDEEKKKRTKSRSSVFNLPATALRKEMQGHESLPPAELGTDLLKWWKHHHEQFPLLSHAVREVYSVQAASSKSERVFSSAGNTVTSLRNRLDAEKVENLMFSF